MLVAYQLFIPPIVGLADQGDFARMIGRFGYGPEDRVKYAFVVRKYVPDASWRLSAWEQVNSEYLFLGSALLVNPFFSKDGKLDVLVLGLVHMLAFLVAFVRLLAATHRLRAAPFIWIAALVILTDVGYVAYWNSFYAEPASCIFFLLLLGDTLLICKTEQLTRGRIFVWTLWAVLLVLAKAQNAPLGILLALISIRFGFWLKGKPLRQTAFASSAVIILATALNVLTESQPAKWAPPYNVLFKAILPESRDASADLSEFGLSPEFAKYSGTGAWSPGSAYIDMISTGLIGTRLTHANIARFYLVHPTRVWRHIRSLLPVAFSLRPEWCGNFERSAGYAPDARSAACSLWSTTRARYLPRVGSVIVVLIVIVPVLLAPAWVRLPVYRPWLELYGLLAACCAVAFLVAVLFDAFDNVKHLFLFNLLLDTFLVATLSVALSICLSRRRAVLDHFAIATQVARRYVRERSVGQLAAFRSRIEDRTAHFPYRVKRFIHRNKKRIQVTVALLSAAVITLGSLYVAMELSSYSFSGSWSDQKEFPILIDESITVQYLPVRSPPNGVDFPGRVHKGRRLSRNTIWVDFGLSDHGESCCIGSLRNPLLVFLRITRDRIDWSNGTYWRRK
jgi:hypothetical protein